MIWPAPEAAVVTLFAGNSVLALPERSRRPEDADLPTLPPPETAAPAARTVLHEGSSRRESELDIGTGEHFHRSVDEPSLVRIDAIGIELGNHGHSEFRIMDDDPLTARAELHRSQTVTRSDWRVRTELTTQLSATHEAFRVRVTLAAYEGDAPVCRREWDEAIPRDLV